MKWKGLEKAQSYARKWTCEISSVLCVHEGAWILHSLSLHQSSQIHIVNTHLHHSLPGIGAFPHVPTTFLLFQGLGRLTTQKRQKTCATTRLWSQLQSSRWTSEENSGNEVWWKHLLKANGSSSVQYPMLVWLYRLIWISIKVQHIKPRHTLSVWPHPLLLP